MTDSENIRRHLLPLVAFALSAVCAGPAWANMPMAPFFAFVKMSMWWVILLALFIETVALRYLFLTEWPHAAKAALSINVISLLCGLILYPLAAVLGYELLDDLIVDLFGASDLVEISALWLGSSVVDAFVELLALRWIFSLRSNFGQSFGFLLANLASAGALVIVMAWQAHVPDMPVEEAARVEREYAPEIAFLRKTLDAFPAHVVVPEPKGGFHRPDHDWTQGLLSELAALRIRTMALSLPPTTVWIKGSTALWAVDSRFKDDDRVVDKGYVDTVLAGQQPRPTGSPHYRYRIERELDGTVYAIEVILRN
ncbi:hypothetical protein OEZ71_14545 [Defluviimonas sp. WL0050]|uniref:Uncharacterized protein n=1 Tax=Albidovulum litorale TaxID=2984134 RepID=A0ABT2ZR46_9RHOB|nr:hypothetical protein [Defluviimonas sp. WL0050]MCV2873517.1 hypothetical protein [Defluviimonas sp. WL0050]